MALTLGQGFLAKEAIKPNTQIAWEIAGAKLSSHVQKIQETFE
jgi:hypothetical protein